jgi:hypothetical protein
LAEIDETIQNLSGKTPFVQSYPFLADLPRHR